MARIPLPDMTALSLEQAQVVESITSSAARKGRLPAPYQLSLENPQLTDIWQRMGALLRYKNSLPLRLSELAILITARHWDCRYEWYAHAPIALRAGVSAQIITSIGNGQKPTFSHADEQVVFDYVTQLHERKAVKPETHSTALKLLNLSGLVDLTALIGYYAMVAMVLNAHEYLPPNEAEHALPDLSPDPLRFTTHPEAA